MRRSRNARPARAVALVLVLLLVLLVVAGCGRSASSPSGEGVWTKEATVDGMKCTLRVKSQVDPEINWAVTDHVVANFKAHAVTVSKRRISLDGKVQKLTSPPAEVVIDAEGDTVVIKADGKDLFRASAAKKKSGRPSPR